MGYDSPTHPSPPKPPLPLNLLAILAVRPNHDQRYHRHRLPPRHGQSPNRSFSRSPDPPSYRGRLYRRKRGFDYGRRQGEQVHAKRTMLICESLLADYDLVVGCDCFALSTISTRPRSTPPSSAEQRTSVRLFDGSERVPLLFDARVRLGVGMLSSESLRAMGPREAQGN